MQSCFYKPELFVLICEFLFRLERKRLACQRLKNANSICLNSIEFLLRSLDCFAILQASCLRSSHQFYVKSLVISCRGGCDFGNSRALPAIQSAKKFARCGIFGRVRFVRSRRDGVCVVFAGSDRRQTAQKRSIHGARRFGGNSAV